MAIEPPVTWPEKLEEAAKWFDTVDKLLAVIEIEDNSGNARRLIDEIGGPSTEIQTDLRQLANHYRFIPKKAVYIEYVGWMIDGGLMDPQP